MNTHIILIVEDQSETAQFLSHLIKKLYPDSQINICESVASARIWLNSNKPVITLIDIGMPDDTGINLLREIKESDQSSLAVIVTSFRDDETIFQALSCGADGYILKEEDEASILSILARIKNGEPPLSPAIAFKLIDFFRQQKIHSTAELSPRETETLKLVAKGYTVPEVAKELGLSSQTVAGYVKKIYQKLHISSRAEATEIAIRRGYI